MQSGPGAAGVLRTHPGGAGALQKQKRRDRAYDTGGTHLPHVTLSDTRRQVVQIITGDDALNRGITGEVDKDSFGSVDNEITPRVQWVFTTLAE